MSTKQITIDGVSGVWRADLFPPKVSADDGVDRWTAALFDLEHDSPQGAWGKLNGGRAASRRDVEYNSRRLPVIQGDSYVSRVKVAAAIAGLPAELVMGIFCRESNHGRSLDSRGRGDRGNAFGVGQVDRRYHDQAGKADPYGPLHMAQCCAILEEYLNAVEKRHPTWSDKYVLKGAVVAYNSGVKNVATIDGMDRGTTGNDYGADVCARAQIWTDIPQFRGTG